MLSIKEVKKEYRTGELVQQALDEVSLNLRDNEFVAILGPSGSGKTTLLNIIGGLDRYDSGDLIINSISTKQYKDRDWDSYRNHTIGFVFQSYNLIPHQTLLANVELALTISGISKQERREKARHALQQVGLLEQCHKKPAQLSGGQMQRVAIARALVNDPDILLADEPTGALDSDTSIQVMDLLKEVAKERLVVMVTHNPELAEQYATRIVRLKDGKITDDSDPYTPHDDTQPPIHQNMGKSSMSFLTALSLSFNNLKTKKGRTILTSFAGSIGIIGIALILSLSTGVNAYIKSIEEDTLSEYPLQIQSTGIDISAMMMGVVEEGTEVNEEQEGDVAVLKMVTKMFSKIGSNDLGAFKRFLEQPDNDINRYTNAIEYQYNIMPQLFRLEKEEYRQVHPDTSFQSLGFGSSASSNSMMSMMMSTDVFFPMPANRSLYENQYEVKAGHWPTSYQECVLVLSKSGRMSDLLLYTLGLRDPKELDEMVKQFANEEAVAAPEDIRAYDYDEILGITFQRVNAADYYVYDEEYGVYTDKSDDRAYMRELIQNGEELRIVGIVQPKDGANATMLRMGLCYPAELTTHVIEEAQASDIVRAQLDHPQINVFTGKGFDDRERSDFSMESLFSINTALLQSAFQIDPSKLMLDSALLRDVMAEVTLPPLDLAQLFANIQIDINDAQIEQLISALSQGYEEYIKDHPDADINRLQAGFQAYLQTPQATALIGKAMGEIIASGNDPQLTAQIMRELIAALMSGYDAYAQVNDLPMLNAFNDSFSDYLNSPQAKAIIMEAFKELMSEIKLEEQLNAYLQNYMSEAMDNMAQSLEQAMASHMDQLGAAFAQAIHFDAQTFANALEFHMSEEELAQLLTTMMTREITSYDTNLKKLGYADFNEPTQIDLYPKDFESKAQVLSILDDYNERMKATDESKVITYTDFVGTLMSSVTDIINVIGYVLIAFVAISLIVSSIMIGVITYISVLERKKEIGILRAIGASKQNISQVFNAETFIIGFTAGAMGILITLLLLIPGNAFIHALAGNSDINAYLPPVAGLILVLLSVILTLLGGLLPSKKAAKEDPVAALRND
ncbi:MAG: ATP-binding cassette domain-containing protein [Erysipelotrichaceae bacterium]|nr:ATP-binding cassette domain-containing protein [Erysipelotrichaceae bacterium]